MNTFSSSDLKAKLFGWDGPRGAGRFMSIPSHRDFVGDLTAGLYQAFDEHSDIRLSDLLILTPTMRAARALSEGFSKAAGGRALLLPQIRGIGDLEAGEPPFEAMGLPLDLPPSISGLTRRLELARLIRDHRPFLDRKPELPVLMSLAESLAEFLDALHLEEVKDPARVKDLVTGDFADHWKDSADFLSVAVDLWPKRLAELGLMDASARQAALLNRLAEQWEEAPPSQPVIVAGSTGTAPSMARLLAAVARAPMGLVVMPGLDHDLAETAWEQVDSQHPQGVMRALLHKNGLERADVRVWPLSDVPDRFGRARRRLLNEALRPAEATKDWRQQIEKLRAEAKDGSDPVKEGLAGLSLIHTRHEEDSASVIALLLREVLETPGKTAALVTPDPALGRRVLAKLSRFGVEADSSAGVLLTATPIGRLLAEVSALMLDLLDPVRLLAVVKNPLVCLGLQDDDLGRARRELERYGLRGARPASLEHLKTRLANKPEASALISSLYEPLALLRLELSKGLCLPESLKLLIQTLEVLGADDKGRLPNTFWGGSSGETAARLLSEAMEAGDVLGPLSLLDTVELIRVMLLGVTVRTGGASHPRLRLLGAIEARLVRADRMILAGLEEGVWPKAAGQDPFLSRPMREKLGLPSPERRIGLSAHDFVQAASTPETYLVVSEKRGGAPVVASRWLWRLQTLAKGAGLDLPTRPEVLPWARALEAPVRDLNPDQAKALAPAQRPEPRPPVEKRPSELAVTRIEQLIRDPYAIYGGYVLRLKPLRRPGEPVGPAERGTAIHAALEAFAEAPEALIETAETWFSARLETELLKAGMRATDLVFERPFVAGMARFATEFERQRRAGARYFIEKKGVFTFKTAGRDFTVTAKADRLEYRASGQSPHVDVIDFKTGILPSFKEVDVGFKPQLPLTGLILQKGGYEELGPVAVNALLYVQINGKGPDGGKTQVVSSDEATKALIESAEAGLYKLVNRYEKASTPYRSWAHPQFLSKRAGDYDHLARVYEWMVVGSDSDAAGGE